MFYAYCTVCKMPMPFESADERDEWALKHSQIKDFSESEIHGDDRLVDDKPYGPFLGLKINHRVLVNNVFRSETYTMSHLAEWFDRNEIQP